MNLSLALAACSWLLSSCSSAPPAESAATVVPVITEAAPGGEAPAYRLTSGDELDIKVADAPQYDQTLKVRPDGKVDASLVGAIQAAGETPGAVQAELRRRYAALAGSDQDREYLIRANDELDIKLPYYPQFNDQIRVRPDGKIQLQLAGTVRAEGMTPEELQLELHRRYAQFLKEPELSVIVRTATSQSIRTAMGPGRGGLTGLQPVVSVRSFQTPQVFVTGEVLRPGMFPYAAGLTLLQVMAEAGGHLPSGDVTKLVIIRKTSDQTAQLLRPGLTKSYRNTPTRDFALAPYDVLLVPPTRAQNLAEALDKYVYKLFAPLKNSTFGYVYGSTKVY